MTKYEYKCEADTDYNYGCSPENRTIEEHINKGIINIDKPSGPTSHEVDIWLRDILHVDKTGHCGTLDPKVTGILPIAINTATKALSLLLYVTKRICMSYAIT